LQWKSTFDDATKNVYRKTANTRTFDLDYRLVLETQLLFETRLILKHCQPGIGLPG